MIDDDFDDHTPVTRLNQNVQRNQKLGHHILKEAQVYLEQISENAHHDLMDDLSRLAQEEDYFAVIAAQLNQPLDSKVANDALNFLYFYEKCQTQQQDFDLFDLITTDLFILEFFKAFDALELNDNKAARHAVLLQAFELYKHDFHAGCVPLLYAQLEGILTDVLIHHGYLQQQGTKLVDVHKIVPGLKGNEIKSLWHKAKIAIELNRYFSELAAYKMDISSNVTMTRHNILHGTDVHHFHRGRSFVLFIWLFSAMSFMSTIKN